MNGVTKITHGAIRKTAGTGYVILNNNQPRDTYINNCFKNQLVNIITNDNEIIPNCIVANGVWNQLLFPTDKSQRGSCVVWINIPYAERVVILGVINKRDELTGHYREQMFKLSREKDQDHSVSLKGDGTQGVFSLLTDGVEKDESQVIFNLLNKNQQALFKVYVQGDVDYDIENKADFRIGNQVTFVIKDEANPSKSAKITYKLGEGFTLEDEHGNKVTTTNNGIRNEVQDSDKVYNVSSGSSGQPAVLGDNLESLLEENNKLLKTFLTTLESVTLGTPPGGFLPKDPFTAIVPKLKLNMINLEKKIKAIKAKNANVS